MSDKDEERITWSTAEPARKIGITERHLFRLIARGEGPRKVHLGRQIVFLPETVETWLREKESAAA